MRTAMIATVGAVASIAALVPAGAAQAGASDVTAVTVAWADASHRAVRVTWSESAPAANSVQLVQPDGIRDIGQTTADGPDEVVLDAVNFGATFRREDALRVVVTAGSDRAGSPAFDNYLPTGPLSLRFLPGGVMEFDLPQLNAPDPTPGDPLDLAGSERFRPTRILTEGEPAWYGCGVDERPEVDKLPYLLPYPAASYLLEMRIVNEWGMTAATGEVRRSEVGLTAPRTAAYGTRPAVTASVTTTTFARTSRLPSCRSFAVGPDAATVLHARRDGATPWSAVGSGRASAGRISFHPVTPGTRQYRAVIPNQVSAAEAVAIYGSVSEPHTVVATSRVLAARFLDPAVNYGQRATAYLAVSPAGSQRTLLQYRTPTGQWRGLAYLTLSSGRGSFGFTWVRRGTTAFRFYLPASTAPGGLPLAASFTPVFALTVR